MNLRKVKVHVILAFVGVAFSVTVQCEGYDTGLLGVRDFRISVISN